MHHRLYVLLAKKDAKTSEEARRTVNNRLEEDGSFVGGGGGMFGTPVCDWFKIGGRWSGAFSANTWGKKLYDKLGKMEDEAGVEVRGVSYGRGSENVEKQKVLREKVEKLYKESLPEKYKNKGLTYDRNSYGALGYEDDAMILTKKLYDICVKPYEDANIADFGTDDHGQPNLIDLAYFWSTEKTEFGEGCIGKRWIVMVDYHS